MTLRWGVLGATSRNHRQRLRPAFGLAGQRIVGEASRAGDDLSAYAEVVADPDVDAVYIPLPNAMHVEWITRSLEAGKHVLCEKPLTMAAADTAAMYALAQSADRHLAEAFMWPHHPRSVRLGELVAAGDLGRLVSHVATFTFLHQQPSDHRVDARGGGALLDCGIYCLGPALCLTDVDPGPVVVATAVRNAAGVDLSMTGWTELGAGLGASFTVSFEAPGRRRHVVVGTDGVVAMDNHFPGPERPGTITVVRRDGTRDEVEHAGANAFERMITAFVAEATDVAEPRWTPTRSIRFATLVDRLHAASSGF